QTDIGARYTYGLYYYQDRENHGGHPIDQTHQFDLWLNHAFTENWQASVQDSFVIAQDPSLVNGGTLLRTEGNNVNNVGSIKLNTQWTRLLGSEFGYQNTFVDYSAHGWNGVSPSYSGLLDRDENLIWLDVNWQLTPTLKPLVGYKFGQANYTGGEQISNPSGLAYNGTFSENKDNRSHYFFVGAQYDPLGNLTLGLQAGVQYVDYYKPAAGLSANSSIEPYADLSATYTYLPGSYVQAGFTQTQSATDVSAPSTSGRITESQNTSTVYGSINHQFTPMLIGSAIGKIQYGTYNGGFYDGDSSTWYTLGLNLTYNFNNHISAEAGYNYDNLDSNVPGQKYARNRVYLGVTATY
ncbi:MAG: outer membrane beta-barrel protein, partial [Gloeomargaritales cyanobacterium]